MPIDKIGSTENYAIVRPNFVKPRPQLRQIEQDTISLTKTARQNAEILRVRDLAMSAPDIRDEKIAELDKKLQEPSYPSQVIISSLANILLDHWSS